MKKLIAIIALAAAVIPAAWAEPTTAELNPEFKDRIEQAIKPKNNGSYGYRKEVRPFVLFHFSDIHSDGEEFARLVAFYTEYEKYFDCAVCTGDIVQASFSKSDFSYWAKTPGHEKIMIIIGNHDTLRDHGNWDAAAWEDLLSMQETYDAYLAANIDNWGAVYEKGKTYWYKDYPEKKMRLVGLDNMLRADKDKAAADGQFRWFEKILSDAKAKGLSVLVCQHMPPQNIGKVDSNFTATGRTEGGWYDETIRYQAAVDKFKKSGGSFVMYLAGHLHRDEICYNKDYPNQLFFCIDSSSIEQCEANSYVMRTRGAKAMDLADAVVVDTSAKTVKIIRVGVNLDSFLRPKNGITLNYETGEIISQY
ncbi:MAG: metallophosphoesterase [Abditibacteriota bacterium]|nr:metallophosphoesterase [Abditibacteriota bacterium]